ncbi:V-type ATP synthase subunit D [bacterium]|nr:V-type ATP synthase subunit D [bacterium]
MAKLRLSKNSLQQQQQQLKLYKKLLPSLDLKRRQLSMEAKKAHAELDVAIEAVEALETNIGEELPMLADEELDFSGLVKMEGYQVGEQNVVGIRLPVLEHVEFAVASYSLLGTPAWTDLLVQRLQDAAHARVELRIAQQRVAILDQAVRRITQRVNLFEKILIPTAKKNIQRIRIYLGDAERAAVVTSKLAKRKQQSADESNYYEEEPQ